MNILFVGDIFASPGRRIVADHLQDIIEANRIDLTIANAENSAGGFQGIHAVDRRGVFGAGGGRPDFKAITSGTSAKFSITWGGSRGCCVRQIIPKGQETASSCIPRTMAPPAR